MMMKDRTTRDSFALSLGGMHTVAGYYAIPAISYNRLRQNQPIVTIKPRQRNWRLWMPRRFRAV